MDDAAGGLRETALRYAKRLRRMRAILAAIAVANTGMFIRDAIAYGLLAAIPAIAAAIQIPAMWQTRLIRRWEDLARQRPDYAAIARMELEIWGGSPR